MDYRVVNGTTYHFSTPLRVVEVLEEARLNRYRLQIVYGGRSNGVEKVPLLLYNSRCIGGHAILDRCIVRIRRVGIYNKWLYEHPTYHGKITIKNNELSVDECTHARFGSVKEIRQYCKKMGFNDAEIMNFGNKV